MSSTFDTVEIARCGRASPHLKTVVRVKSRAQCARRSCHMHAAGDIDALTGHEARPVGAEKGHDVGDVLGLLEASKGSLGNIFRDHSVRRKASQAGLPFDLPRLHPRLHEARTYGVHANALGSELA